MNVEKHATILLVEDEILIAMVTQMKIRRFGYDVVTAHSGEEAVKLAVENDQISLVLMDINLGCGIDGTEAAQQILAVRQLPIVFLTSHAEDEYVSRVREITRYGYVIKNSGDFVLKSSIDMAFELFDEHRKTRENEEQYRTLFSEMLDGFALHEIICSEAGKPIDYRFLIVNPAFERITGLKAEAITGRTVLDVLPGTERYWIETYGRVALTGESIVFQNYAVELNKYFEVRAYRPSPNHFACVFQDITAHRQAEEALRESEEKYRRLFETMSPGVVYHAADGQIISANPAAENLLGLTLEQMRGKTSWDPRWKMMTETGEEVPGSEHPSMIALRTGKKVGPVMRGVYIPEKDDYVWLSITAIPLFQPGETTPFQVYATFDDITERKQAEKTLQESEARFKALHNASFGGIAIHDKGIILDCNQGLSEMTGYTIAELMGMDGLKLIAEKSRELVMHNILTGCEKPYEAVGLRKTGEEFPMRLEARNVPYKGKMVRTVEFRDMTDYKQAEKALQESEAAWKSYVENAPYGIFIADRSGRYLEVNPAACQITGYRADELVAMGIPDLLVPEIREAGLKHFEHVLREGEARGDVRFRRKDGEVRWWTVSARQIAENRFIGFCEDVTDRKRAEDALREKNDLLQRIFDDNFDLIALTDLEGNFTSVGKSHEILGYDIDSLIDKNVMDFVHPQDLPYVATAFEEFMRSQEKRRVEYRYQRIDGEYLWFETIGTILKDKTGNPEQLLFNTRDITARKRAEEALQKSERELRELNAAKDKFFAIMAHDLKNFAVAFDAGTTLLHEQLQHVDDEHAKWIAHELYQTAQRMQQLLENLLEWAQMERGLLPYHPVKIEVYALATDALDLLAAYARHKQLDARCAIQEGVCVHADVHMLQTVLRNLLSNAVKFTKPGGVITVEANDAGDCVEISVRDTGVGMSPEKIQRLFSIGERNISTTGTAGEKGTGLGLILCKEFVEKHGGRIWCESEPGVGSTFRFTLPAP